MGLSVWCIDQAGPFYTCVFSAESCLLKAVGELGLHSGRVDLAGTSSEDEAATGTAFAFM